MTERQIDPAINLLECWDRLDIMMGKVRTANALQLSAAVAEMDAARLEMKGALWNAWPELLHKDAQLAAHRQQKAGEGG
jgi:hypothetical protein